MEFVMSLLLGIGLSASCGFRVFVPLLVMSIFSRAGHLTLNESFAFIGSTPALVVFSIATVVEIAGYYIPWVDNFLDTIATPTAFVAGVITTGAVVHGVSPLVAGVCAIILGGGAAIAVQSGTVVIRGVATATSGGIVNPAVSTSENFAATACSVASIALPILVLGLFAMFAGVVFWYWRRKVKQAAGASTEGHFVEPAIP